MPLTIAGTIGGIPCHGWTGTIAAARSVLDVFNRPGVDYSGFQILHRRAPSSQIQTVSVATTTTEAQATKTSAEAMVGTVVRVVDHLGKEWESVRIDDVSVTVRACRGLSASAGVQAAARVDISWTMEAQQ